MYGCESWTIKKTEHWRIDAFELRCWRRLDSPSDWKEVKSVNPKGNQPWIFIGRTDVEAEAPILWPPQWAGLIHWKRSWCWERLKAGGEGNDRGWDGWMVPPTRWTRVWPNSQSWWWTGKPTGVLQPVGLQRVRQDWATELTYGMIFLQRIKRKENLN